MIFEPGETEMYKSLLIKRSNMLLHNILNFDGKFRTGLNNIPLKDWHIKCRLALQGLLNHFELLKRDHSSWAQSFLIVTGNPGTQLANSRLLPSDHFQIEGSEY